MTVEIKQTDEIKLNEMVDAAAGEALNEQKAAVKQKVRWVFDQCVSFERECRRLENELAKKRESLAKAQDKLKRLRDGDWEVLKQINPQEQPKAPE